MTSHCFKFELANVKEEVLEDNVTDGEISGAETGEFVPITKTEMGELVPITKIKGIHNRLPLT